MQHSRLESCPSLHLIATGDSCLRILMKTHETVSPPSPPVINNRSVCAAGA